MEKFITAPVKIELLTDRINKLDENPEEILKIYKETNVTKLKKDLDVERERYKGVKIISHILKLLFSLNCYIIFLKLLNLLKIIV